MANLITTLEEKNSTVFGNKRDLQDRCTVMRTKSETFFYCNTPEGVGNGALADSGKYLLYKGVRGSGHLYTWHQNETSSSIYSVILIYNANSFPIQVNFTNIGLTNLRDGNDSAAWQSYYTGNRSESAEIPAGGYKSMLVQSGIAANNVFGKIARFSIINKNTGATAAAFFYDLAYRLPENSGNAHAPAACDIPTDASLKNSKRRGLGDGFYNYLEIGLSGKPVELTDSIPERAATIGGVYAQTDDINDSFRGADMAMIVGETGDKDNLTLRDNDSGYLYGSFGMQMRVTMRIKNSSSQAREIRIFLGAKGAHSVPVFARYNKAFYSINNKVAPGRIRDVISLGTVAAGTTQEIVFDTVNLAQSIGCFYIGARLV